MGHSRGQIHVAVCIPFSNREDTLPVTLKSIVNDGYEKSRVSIVLYDDGSTDSSSLIAEEFIKVYGHKYSQVIYRRSTVPSRGNIAKARNRCFSLARDTQAQYLISVDSDVEMPAGTIQDLVDLAEKDRRVGIASIPYTYAKHSSAASQRLDVDVTLGCTILSRELLDRIDWRINERFDKVDDLWLGAKAEKLGFKIICHNQSRALHLKPIIYRDHLKRRLFEVPRYHYLLLKEGLLTRRLRRTYAYYAAFLLSLAFCLASSVLTLAPALLLVLGVLHYRSLRKFAVALPVGVAMTIGFTFSILRGVLQRPSRLNASPRGADRPLKQ
ncbi:glycosyltransferase [Candidatus Bathyarchaeota archaeon]|nr:glycosyltransferase [Candidatus Bathyarchaeota archaeon]